MVSGYPVLTAVNWLQHWCAICLQYQSSCAPKLARKCEIEHWLPCGAVYGHVITKFSGMVRFTHPWCFAGALRAPELRKKNCIKILYPITLRNSQFNSCLSVFQTESGFEFLAFRRAEKNHSEQRRESTPNKLIRTQAIFVGEENALTTALLLFR